MSDAALPFDPSPEQMRAMGETVVETLVSWIGGLEDAPATNTEDALNVAQKLVAEPPEQGTTDFEGILADAVEAARHTFEFSGPGYLAYVPGGGLYSSALAQFLAEGMNRFGGLWQASPAMVQIEENVTRWLGRVVGFPETSQGLLTTGGSLANLSAFVTARHEKLGQEFLDGIYYVTDQSHASNTKAATIAGFGSRNVRIVPTDGSLKMDPEALAQMVHEDRATGLRPFLIVASAGTTNTGSIDPLAAIAEVAEREGLWLHVDGAYGGFFMLTDRGKRRLKGIESADSVTLDPHKGMFLPYGTGGLVVKDGKALRDAHFEGAAYLQDLPPAGDLPNYSDLSPELSRGVRGLRVWFPLVLHGVSSFRRALDEKLNLAEHLYRELSSDARLDVPWTPEVTVVPFRLRDADRETNEALLGRINASKRVYLSSTLVHGEYWIRPCIVSHRTHQDRIDECVAIVRAAVDEIAG